MSGRNIAPKILSADTPAVVFTRPEKCAYLNEAVEIDLDPTDSADSNGKATPIGRLVSSSSASTSPSTLEVQDAVVDVEQTFEQILEHTGSWGVWQYWSALMNMIMTVVCALQTVSYPMLVGKFDSWCRVPSLSYNDDADFIQQSTLNITAASLQPVVLPGAMWTMAERRNFSTPVASAGGYSLRDSECLYFERDYSLLSSASISFLDALKLYNTSTVQHTKSCDTLTPARYIFQSSYFVNSLRNEFQLVCGRLWLEPIVHASFTIGSMIGVFTFGWLSDRFGRRRTLRYIVPVLIVVNFALAITPNMTIFLLVRFVQGMVNFGMFTVVYIISMESTSAARRPFVGNLVHIPWGFTFVAVSVLGWAIHDWRWLQAAISLPCLLCLLFFTPLLPESPRWLIFHGSHTAACDELQRGMRLNKAVVIDRVKLESQVQTIYNAHLLIQRRNTAESNGKHHSVSVLTLFRTPEMRRRTLLQFVVWFQGAMSNHGINFYAPRLAENPFLSYGLVGIGEILAPSVGAYLFQLGRRIPIAGTYLFGAVVCFLMLPCLQGNLPWGLLALTVIGTFLSDMAFNGVYVHTSELYPTVVRNLGLGSCSAAARVGSSLASFIVTTNDQVWWLPPVIFGGVMTVGAVATMALPATENRVLPETIPEVEEQAETRIGNLFMMRSTPRKNADAPKP